MCGHMSTLTVDCQNRDMVNIWRHLDISGGDMLCVNPEPIKVKKYVLNYYYKGILSVEFLKEFTCIQLVPRVLNMEMLVEGASMSGLSIGRVKVNTPLTRVAKLNTGFWKIAQSMVAHEEHNGWLPESRHSVPGGSAPTGHLCASLHGEWHGEHNEACNDF